MPSNKHGKALRRVTGGSGERHDARLQRRGTKFANAPSWNKGACLHALQALDHLRLETWDDAPVERSRGQELWAMLIYPAAYSRFVAALPPKMPSALCGRCT